MGSGAAVVPPESKYPWRHPLLAEPSQRACWRRLLRPVAASGLGVYEDMNARGVYCSLLTGQERKEVPFATTYRAPSRWST